MQQAAHSHITDGACASVGIIDNATAQLSRRGVIGLATLAPLALALTAPAVAATPEPMDALWSAWRNMMSAIVRTDDDNDLGWHTIGDLEAQIANAAAATSRGVSYQLLVSLMHMEVPRWADDAIVNDDLATLFARQSELDFEMRLIVRAVQGLERLS